MNGRAQMLTRVSHILCRVAEGGRVELGGGRCTSARFAANSSATRPSGAVTVVSTRGTNRLCVVRVGRPSPARTGCTLTSGMLISTLKNLTHQHKGQTICLWLCGKAFFLKDRLHARLRDAHQHLSHTTRLLPSSAVIYVKIKLCIVCHNR